jgi:hypothetical protein
LATGSLYLGTGTRICSPLIRSITEAGGDRETNKLHKIPLHPKSQILSYVSACVNCWSAAEQRWFRIRKKHDIRGAQKKRERERETTKRARDAQETRREQRPHTRQEETRETTTTLLLPR